MSPVQTSGRMCLNEVTADEGVERRRFALERCASPGSTPHPTSLRSATFSHKGRRGSAAAALAPIVTAGDLPERPRETPPSPLVGEGA